MRPQVPFEQLYAERHAPMVRLARLLVGSVEEAEELVQDAFVRVHARYDTVEEPAAYLRTAVVNACRNRTRRRVLERERTPTTVEAVLPPEVDAVWESLQRLEARRRTALVLRYYEDLPVAEVGRLMGCSEGAAASLIRRALADMKEVLS